MKRRTFAERFADKWHADDAGCWLWKEYCDKDGYGRVRVGGRKLPAHRVSYELHVGPITDGLWVLHRCDRPTCVNPDHLFLGTPADNVRDMIQKGRKPLIVGERAGAAKLTAQQVTNIRQRYAAGEMGYKLAIEFGVSKSLVSLVVRGDRWKHVGVEAQCPGYANTYLTRGSP